MERGGVGSLVTAVVPLRPRAQTAPREHGAVGGGRLVRGRVPGRPARPQDTPALVDAIAAFHELLAQEPLPAFRQRAYPATMWDRADVWAWGDLPESLDSRVVEPLACLALLRRPLHGLPEQLIHGDLNPSNFIISPDAPPAIIDMTPYWRPAGFASAIAAYWLGPFRGDETILAHFEHIEGFDQLLVRAALRMLLTFRDPANVGDISREVAANEVIRGWMGA